MLLFGWRQPFRHAACPDWLPAPPAGGAPGRGVVLVHGFMCNRGIWNPWMRRLRARGHAHVAVTLEPGDEVRVMPLDPEQYVDIGIGVTRKDMISPAAARFIAYAKEHIEEMK